MNVTSIQTLTMQAVEAFHLRGYTKQSVDERKRILLKIVELHDKEGACFYSADVISKFVQEAECRYENGEIQRIYYRFLTKTTACLAELYDTGAISFGQNWTPKLSEYYEGLLCGILAYENWGEKVRHSVWPFAKTYFGWLHSQGHSNLNRIDEKVIKRYLIDCASRMTNNSLGTTKRALKKLFTYLFEIGLGANTYENLFSFSVPMERKIKRSIPHSEIAAVLDVIDRRTPEGKRDYAMILLAAVTGLRAVDIAGLKLSNIDWRNGELKITQSKTEKPLALPLTTDVGMAVQDYILNARPDSTLPNVFLRSRAPIKEISSDIPYGQFNGYRLKIGLPKCSFHGLRRTLGSNMVISGTPVTMVAQVLGHSEIDSTKQYISLDTKHLKECALDFTGIELVKSGGAR